MTAAACSPTRSRKRWCPALQAPVSAGYTASAPMHSSFNASGRARAARRRADALVVDRRGRAQRGAQPRLPRPLADDKIEARLAVEQRLAFAHRPPDVAGAEREQQLAQHRRVDAARLGTADRAGPLDFQ